MFRRYLFSLSMLTLGACATQAPGPAPSAPSVIAPGASANDLGLAPEMHGSFGHYTLALTWQPGFCATKPVCTNDQPHDATIGLHGLWASRPKDLIDAGVTAPQWWVKGCDYYRHSDAAPELSPAVASQLDNVVAHLPTSLVTHEYDKHVQCFGMNADHFFSVALNLRNRLQESDFGRKLRARSATYARKSDIIADFSRESGTALPRALQLRCEPGADGQPMLTQLWFTLSPDQLNDFPRSSAFVDAPELQDNCPARFLVPRWS